MQPSTAALENIYVRVWKKLLKDTCDGVSSFKQQLSECQKFISVWILSTRVKHFKEEFSQRDSQMAASIWLV